MLNDTEQRLRFELDGYLIFDPEIPSATLDNALADLADKYDSDQTSAPYADACRIQDAWRISENAKAIALAPKVLSLLEEIYECTPLPFQTLNFRVGTEQHPHSDTIHFNSLPSGYMCGVWVALEDIDMENGPLVYYPGSQRLPELTVEHINTAFPPETDDYTMEDLHLRYNRLISDRIARFGLKPFYATIKKGQALLWSANLLHGGALQVDKSRTRFSQVTHYYFEGCQYYTPWYSRGINIHWRRPVWIPGSPGRSGAVTEKREEVSSAPAYEGHLDVCDCHVISGWVWDKNRPNVPINVAIYDGDAFLATEFANLPRSDVAQYTGDKGLHGFAYETPPDIKDGRAHRISVRIGGTNTDLANSPKQIICASDGPL